MLRLRGSGPTESPSGDRRKKTPETVVAATPPNPLAISSKAGSESLSPVLRPAEEDFYNELQARKKRKRKSGTAAAVHKPSSSDESEDEIESSLQDVSQKKPRTPQLESMVSQRIDKPTYLTPLRPNEPSSQETLPHLSRPTSLSPSFCVLPLFYFRRP